MLDRVRTARVTMNVHDLDGKEYDALPYEEISWTDPSGVIFTWKVIETPTLAITFFPSRERL